MQLSAYQDRSFSIGRNWVGNQNSFVKTSFIGHHFLALPTLRMVGKLNISLSKEWVIKTKDLAPAEIPRGGGGRRASVPAVHVNVAAFGLWHAERVWPASPPLAIQPGFQFQPTTITRGIIPPPTEKRTPQRTTANPSLYQCYRFT